MAQNHTFNHVIRSQILQSKSRLYRNQSVLQEWEDMLHYIHNSPRPVPFYSHSSSLIYPYPNPTDTVHPHIVSDLQTIQKFNFSQTERIPEEFFFALSIPYIDPPLRVKDLMPSVNYDITSRLYQV